MKSDMLYALFVGWLFLAASMVYGDEGKNECGKGPVTIKVADPIPCENACNCSLAQIIPGGSYHRSCLCTLQQCWSSVEEMWSDWPECGGQKLDLETQRTPS